MKKRMVRSFESLCFQTLPPATTWSSPTSWHATGIESDQRFFRVAFWPNNRLDGTGFNASYQFIDDVDTAHTVRPTLMTGGSFRHTLQGLLWLSYWFQCLHSLILTLITTSYRFIVFA
ncbi:hypothetical protein J6590_043058 [Homalodisca vitripennis]|nr:hypothetical protein J6590_043058 [Homalodisca vitripennis]